MKEGSSKSQPGQQSALGQPRGHKGALTCSPTAALVSREDPDLVSHRHFASPSPALHTCRQTQCTAQENRNICSLLREQRDSCNPEFSTSFPRPEPIMLSLDESTEHELSSGKALHAETCSHNWQNKAQRCIYEKSCSCHSLSAAQHPSQGVTQVLSACTPAAAYKPTPLVELPVHWL